MTSIWLPSDLERALRERPGARLVAVWRPPHAVVDCAPGPGFVAMIAGEPHNRRIEIRQIGTGALLATCETPVKVIKLALTPDGRTVLASGWEGTRTCLVRWDHAAGTAPRVWTLQDEGGGGFGQHFLQAIVISPDGREALLAADGFDPALPRDDQNTGHGKLWLWDLATDSVRWRAEARRAHVTATFLPENGSVVIADGARVWAARLASGECLWRKELGETLIQSALEGGGTSLFGTTSTYIPDDDSGSSEDEPDPVDPFEWRSDFDAGPSSGRFREVMVRVDLAGPPAAQTLAVSEDSSRESRLFFGGAQLGSLVVVRHACEQSGGKTLHTIELWDAAAGECRDAVPLPGQYVVDARLAPDAPHLVLATARGVLLHFEVPWAVPALAPTLATGGDVTGAEPALGGAATIAHLQTQVMAALKSGHWRHVWTELGFKWEYEIRCKLGHDEQGWYEEQYDEYTEKTKVVRNPCSDEGALVLVLRGTDTSLSLEERWAAVLATLEPASA